MCTGRLVVTTLTWATVALAGASRGETPRGFVPAPPRPIAKAPATVSDPAEPPVKVEAAYDDEGAVPAPGQARQAVAVAASARGTTLTLNTPGWYKGSAWLTFNNPAPPMRFTIRLAGLHELDLEKLSLSSGRLSLHVGPVTASGTTKYFDATGREQDKPEGAAYTVKARRWSNGQVDVQLQRAPGATLDRGLTVTWRGDVGEGLLK
jgi:hypothetical protein